MATVPILISSGIISHRIADGERKEGVQSEYDGFAEDYDWLFSDSNLTGESRFDSLRPVLESLPATSRILDCACGTGILALALAQRGYNVFGTDASEGMVKVAKERAAREGLSIPFQVCPWTDLPKGIDTKFDLAVCCGNSIGHCRDAEDMIRSLRGIRSALKNDGQLVLDTRNWEKLLAERTRFTHYAPRVRNGKRCIPLYVWNFPLTVGEPIHVEVVLPIEQAGKAELHSYSVAYHPFTFQELEARLEEAGFTTVSSNYSQHCAEYQVLARCRSG